MLNTRKRLARKALLGLLITFLFLRTLVYFIMSHHKNSYYVFLDGIHIHHFNEGIFLLVIVAGLAIFSSKEKYSMEWMALLYGIALALIFDEFGMWLHLDMVYWQKISVNIVFLILTLFAVLAFAPPRKDFNLFKSIILAIIVIGFIALMHLVAIHLRAKYAEDIKQLNCSSSNYISCSDTSKIILQK